MSEYYFRNKINNLLMVVNKSKFYNIFHKIFIFANNFPS